MISPKERLAMLDSIEPENRGPLWQAARDRTLLEMEEGLTDYDKRVFQDRDKRVKLRGEGHLCPVCEVNKVVPLGGFTSCWWECPCGAYSPMARTWEEALQDVANWQMIDPELNARMHPPVGG